MRRSNLRTLSAVKHGGGGGGSTMLWVCFAASGRGTSNKGDEIMEADYLQIGHTLLLLAFTVLSGLGDQEPEGFRGAFNSFRGPSGTLSRVEVLRPSAAAVQECPAVAN